MANFAQLAPLIGFDSDPAPPWQMVPTGGARPVFLVNGQGLNVVSTNPRVVTVVELPMTQNISPRLITLAGVAKGNAFIEARNAAGAQARLEVDVKDKKTVRASFNYVRDNAGHTTTRAVADAGQLIRGVNDILLAQANVEMTLHTARPVTVNQNLHRVVMYARHLRNVPRIWHEWDLVTALGDSTADFNVFFVWEYEQDDSPYTDNAEAGTLGANCIFEDNTVQDAAETLAHEFGHFLGCPDVNGAGLLMSPAGRRVRKHEVNTMNP